MRTFFLLLLPSLIEGHARYFLENNRCNTHTLEAGKTIMGVRLSPRNACRQSHGCAPLT